MNSEKTAISRIDALDFTKGMLVVCMVVYHSLNYSTRFELGFRYMAFLPPSFILITGFLVSRVYFVRARAGDKTVCQRLLVRGGKLLALFTALNIVASLARGTNSKGGGVGLGNFIDNWFDIYVSGGSRLAAFEVLLPIAYLLLLAPLLLWMDRWQPAALPMATIAALLLFAILEQRGTQFANGGMVGAGMLGMVLGRVSGGSLDLLGRYWAATLVAYGLYVFVSLSLGQPYLLHLIGACIALGVFYGLGVRAGGEGWFQDRLQALGRYSLVSYIVQIAILQLLSRWIGRPEPASLAFIATLLGTLILTVALVEAVHWTRGKSTGMNVLYKAVFA